MHSFVRRNLTRWASMILLAGAAWTGHPSNTVMAARAFDVTHAVHTADDRIATAARIRLPQRLEPAQVADFQMIELLVIACRADNCREVSLLYDAYEMSLMTCMIAGQQEAARWQSSNPAWEIRRWSCRFMRSTEGSA